MQTVKKIVSSIILLLSLSTLAQEVTKLQLDQVITTDGLYIEPNGIIYATEGWNGNKIYKISPQGHVSVFATGLQGPIDILKGKDGNFYVSEWNAPQLSKIDSKGHVTKFVTVKLGAGPMTQDNNGNIYVTHNVNDGSGFISRVSMDGIVSISAQGNHLINPGGIDFDSKGNLYVSNFNNANIVKIDKTGNQKIIATVPGDKEWRTGHLKIVDDVIYVTGLMDHRIYNVKLDGQVKVFAGTGEPGNETGSAKTTKLFNPNGLFYNSKTEELFFSIAFSKAGFLQKINLNEKVKE